MDLLRRFLRLAKGFLGLFIGDLEEQSPEALLEAAKQDYNRRVAQYHQSLARIGRRRGTPQAANRKQSV